MLCNICGRFSPDDQLFCRRCGAPLDVKNPEYDLRSHNSREEIFKWASKLLNHTHSEAALKVLNELVEIGHEDALIELYNYYGEIDLFGKECFHYIKLLYKLYPKLFGAEMLGTLAYCYSANIQNADDAKKTMQYALEAYKMGNDVTPFLIGEMYYRGMGVSCDEKKAAEWFEISFRMNPKLYEGVARWGLFLFHGLGGVKKDRKKGRQLWLEAANHGNESAKKYLEQNPESKWDYFIY